MPQLHAADDAGIYVITHLPTGSVYVGQANNIRRRWNEHRRWLQALNHHNMALQTLWTSSKDTDFEFEVVSTAPTDLTPLQLQRWLVKEERRIIKMSRPGGVIVNDADPEIVATKGAVTEYQEEEEAARRASKAATKAHDEGISARRREIKKQLERLRTDGAPNERRLDELNATRRKRGKALWQATGWRRLFFGRPLGFDPNEEKQQLLALDAEMSQLRPVVQANWNEGCRLDQEYRSLHKEFSKVSGRRRDAFSYFPMGRSRSRSRISE